MTRSSHPSRHALPGVVVPAQLDYAIRGLVSLALATEARTKVEVLAADHGLSRKFLAQVLVALRNAGIVTTHRGSEGGYGLARRPDEIPIVKVFDALSAGTGYAPRSANGSRAATVTEDAWSTLSGAIRATLSRITLADLVETPRTRGNRTAGGMGLEASGTAPDLRPGAREEITAPRGA